MGKKDHDPVEPLATGHAKYMPPWAEVHGGKRFEYGPRSESSLQQRLRDYRQSKAGGGLWDDEDECNPRKRSGKERRAADRYDWEVLSVWIGPAYLRGQVSSRMMECFLLYWRDRRSMGQTAAEMGVKRSTAEYFVKEIRKAFRQL